MQVRMPIFSHFSREIVTFFSRSSSLVLFVCLHDVLACIHEDQLLLSFTPQVQFDCGEMERTCGANG